MPRAGRLVLVLLLVRWTWLFLVWPMRQDVIGASFLHLISIPFHEAGHILFLPFGDLMTTLGGIRSIPGNATSVQGTETGTYTLGGNTMALRAASGQTTLHTVIPFNTAIDPAKAAIANMPGGANSGTGSVQLPAFRVTRVRSLNGSCQ